MRLKKNIRAGKINIIFYLSLLFLSIFFISSLKAENKLEGDYTNIKILDILYCPHHGNGTIAEFTRECDCRKPAPGLIYQAASAHDIDLESSVLVGDKICHILVGDNVCHNLVGDKLCHIFGGDEVCHILVAPKFAIFLVATKFVAFWWQQSL